MVALSLKKQFFKEIYMERNAEENKQLNLESTFSFSVSYNDDNSFCVGTLRQEIKSKQDAKEFHIVVEGLGYFDCEGIKEDEDKKQAHVQSYTLLFPYIQNMIAELSRQAGLLPIIVNMVQMQVDDVIVKDNN